MIQKFLKGVFVVEATTVLTTLVVKIGAAIRRRIRKA
jgi:hypothetical protein